MLRFLSGVLVGWTAARTLPPKDPNASAFAPPTLHELSILTEKVRQMYKTLQKRIEEESKESN